MSDEHLESRLAALVRTLKPKTKAPNSAEVRGHRHSRVAAVITAG